MNLKGDYSIDESGRHTVIFEDEEGEEWEVEFALWIGKEYIYEETGRCLVDVNVQEKCMSPVFSMNKKVTMEVALEEYVTNNFSI